jgi:TonB family protein
MHSNRNRNQKEVASAEMDSLAAADDRFGRRMTIGITLSVAANVLLLQGAGALKARPLPVIPPGQTDATPPIEMRLAQAPVVPQATPTPQPPEKRTEPKRKEPIEPLPAPKPEPRAAVAAPKANASPRRATHLPEASATPRRQPDNEAAPSSAGVAANVFPAAALQPTDAPEAITPGEPRGASGLASHVPSRALPVVGGPAGNVRTTMPSSPADITVTFTAPAVRTMATETRTGVVGAAPSFNATLAPATDPVPDTTIRLATHPTLATGRPGRLSHSAAPRMTVFGSRGASSDTPDAVTPAGLVGGVRSSVTPAARGTAGSVALSVNTGGSADIRAEGTPLAVSTPGNSSTSTLRGHSRVAGRLRPTYAAGPGPGERPTDSATGGDIRGLGDAARGAARDGSRYADTNARRNGSGADIVGGKDAYKPVKGDDGPAPIRDEPRGSRNRIDVRATAGDSVFFGSPAGSIVNARILEFVPPAIPETLRRTRLSVRLEAKVAFSAGGQRRVEIVQGSGYPELDRAVVAALSASRFQAPTVDGKKVDAVLPVSLPITIGD